MAGTPAAGEDNADVILAGDDGQHRADEQNQQAGGQDTHHGGLDDVRAVLGKPAVVAGQGAADGEGANGDVDAAEEGQGLCRFIGGDGGCAVVGHHGHHQAVDEHDDEQGDGDVVEPLQPLEAKGGRGHHDDAPDDGAEPGGDGQTGHGLHHSGEGRTADRRLDAEPADAGQGQMALMTYLPPFSPREPPAMTAVGRPVSQPCIPMKHI